jgi:hypothetical protein
MNVFQNNIVTAIKVGGKVLRENGDTVTLPFGSEYSILVKNLNSVRAQIAVSVDGLDAVGKVIVGPNSGVELERFIRNGNLEAGNRFRFIERTPEIEGHRGIQADDGLVRVEAWREQVTLRVPVPRVEYYDDPIPVPSPRPYPWYPPRPSHYPRYPSRPMHPTSRSCSDREVNSCYAEQTRSGTGITVAGSESRQRFLLVGNFRLEPVSTVIVLRLRGEIGGEPVEMPVTVNHKPECRTCGTKNSAASQFCGQCGTALVLI